MVSSTTKKMHQRSFVFGSALNIHWESECSRTAFWPVHMCVCPVEREHIVQMPVEENWLKQLRRGYAEVLLPSFSSSCSWCVDFIWKLKNSLFEVCHSTSIHEEWRNLNCKIYLFSHTLNIEGGASLRDACHFDLKAVRGAFPNTIVANQSATFVVVNRQLHCNHQCC